MKKSIPLACALCLLLSTPEVRAQPAPTPREEAAQRYQEAETSFKLNKYEEALAGFQESYALSNEPSILFNIAQCYRLMGRLEEAKKTYLSFLRDAPDSPLSANARARIADVEAEMKHLATKGSIQISSKQDPTEVFLNGEPKGLSPITINEIEPGEHTITIKKTGFADYQIIATVNPAQPLELNIPRLVPLSGVEGDATKILRWGAVGFGSAGLLSAGASGLFLFLANQEQNDTTALDLNNDGVIDLEDFQDKGQLIRDKADPAKNLGIVSGVLVGTAITSLTASLILKKKNKGRSQ